MRLIDYILAVSSRVASIAAGTGILILMLLTVADGVERMITGRGIPGTVEITEVFLVIVIFAGMLGAEVTDSHISTSLVTDMLPARARQGARLIGTTISLFGASLFAYASAAPALQSLAIQEVKFGLVRVPIYPAKIFVFLGFLLLAVAILCSVVRQIINLRQGPDGAVSLEEGLPVNSQAMDGETPAEPDDLPNGRSAGTNRAQHHEKVFTYES